MESSLTHAYQIRLQNFEGPFDLLFHLIEKNQVSLYDIPINEITDQYMDYLFTAQQFDMEIASEFLVMAATLLHIKSRMLLPEKPGKAEEQEQDPRQELVRKLIEYKQYKDFSMELRILEKEWEGVLYKLPEAMAFEREEALLELSTERLQTIYIEVMRRYKGRQNPGTMKKIEQILEHERISLKTKMKEIARYLVSRPFFKFSELFSFKKKPRVEVVTGFMAILELAKHRKAKLVQKQRFSEILVYRGRDETGTASHAAVSREEEGG